MCIKWLVINNQIFIQHTGWLSMRICFTLLQHVIRDCRGTNYGNLPLTDRTTGEWRRGNSNTAVAAAVAKLNDDGWWVVSHDRHLLERHAGLLAGSRGWHGSWVEHNM